MLVISVLAAPIVVVVILLTFALRLPIRPSRFPPPSIGDPTLDRDRERVLEDLRWLAQAEPLAPLKDPPTSQAP